VVPAGFLDFDFTPIAQFHSSSFLSCYRCAMETIGDIDVDITAPSMDSARSK
jgi:hypothetical protein